MHPSSRAKGQSKREEGDRESKREGKQPVTESGTLSSMETRKDIRTDRHTGSAHRGRELDQTGEETEKRPRTEWRGRDRN